MTASFFLLTVGFVLNAASAPTAAVAVASGLGVIWLLVQTLLEEWDLRQRIPAYGEYLKRVPRFVPRPRAK